MTQSSEPVSHPQSWTDDVSNRFSNFAESSRGVWILAILLFLLAAGLRLPFLDADPPEYERIFSGSFATDEGIWSFLARQWVEGHDPFARSESLAGSLSLPYTSAQWLMFQTFGVGLVQVRITGALLGCLLPVAFFLLGRRLFGPGPAFAIGLLAATNLLLIMYQRTGMIDAWLIFWVTLAFLGWERALASGQTRDAVIAGLLTAFTLWSKVTAVPFLIAAALTGLWHLLDRHYRPTMIRLGLAFSGGFLALSMIPLGIYLSWPALAAAAKETLEVNPNKIAPDLMGWLWHIRGVLFHNPFNSFMPVITLVACFAVAALGLAVLQRKPSPLSLCAALWGPLVAAMLVVHGYIPPRYFLQAIPAIFVLGVQALAWLWTQGPRLDGGRGLVRALVILVFAVELLVPLAIVGDWMGSREYSQREVGEALAEDLGPDRELAEVSGRWAFDLALTGDFQPMGFYGAGQPWLQETPSRGGTHFLYQGEVPEEHIQGLRDQGLGIEYLATYDYLRNYYEAKKPLSLYKFIPLDESGDSAAGSIQAAEPTLELEEPAPQDDPGEVEGEIDEQI